MAWTTGVQWSSGEVAGRWIEVTAEGRCVPGPLVFLGVGRLGIHPVLSVPSALLCFRASSVNLFRPLASCWGRVGFSHSTETEAQRVTNWPTQLMHGRGECPIATRLLALTQVGEGVSSSRERCGCFAWMRSAVTHPGGSEDGAQMEPWRSLRVSTCWAGP